MDTVTITKKEYDNLLEDSRWMRAYEEAGISGWEGYDFAMFLLKTQERIQSDGKEIRKGEQNAICR
jgi:hypothetical protein